MEKKKKKNEFVVKFDLIFGKGITIRKKAIMMISNEGKGTEKCLILFSRYVSG